MEANNSRVGEKNKLTHLDRLGDATANVVLGANTTLSILKSACLSIDLTQSNQNLKL